VFEASNRVVVELANALQGELPIIGAGGILDGRQARAKLEAGAQLVQLYSGLIYRGPALVHECVAATSAM
jgi:dihydroorotate dehydrogenase